MKSSFGGWNDVADQLHRLAATDEIELNAGQRASLRALAARLPENGVLIADEVGLGKTRIAAAVAAATVKAGGRVAIVVPPGLGYQWRDELVHKAGIADVPPLLRSLDGFLDAWGDDQNVSGPWGELPVVCLSHAFCNWAIRSNTKSNWKWALLPATLALARARINGTTRLPRGYWSSGGIDDERVKNAAQWIFDATEPEQLDSLARKAELAHWGTTSPLFDPGQYVQQSPFRLALQRVVGHGLGRFDLLILDEAHKSRGDDSNLNRLLNTVLTYGTDARRMALTATPIELDSEQWKSTLARIAVFDQEVQDAISAYGNAVTTIRRCPADPARQTAFADGARRFKGALGTYLLRRDKREDEWVSRFAEHTSEGRGAYRHEHEIRIDASALPLHWRQAVCAAEALSFVTRGQNDPLAKRLRLTVGNGHSIATLLDQLIAAPEDDLPTSAAIGETEATLAETAVPQDKRALRAHWWKQVLAGAFGQQGDFIPSSDDALFEHPAILAAVQAIEAVCLPPVEEKVLVFGRFTRPMKALVQLLNARAMLRCLDSGQHWPQKLLDDTQRHALSAALRLAKRTDSMQTLESRLAAQYPKLESLRAEFRAQLLPLLEQALAQVSGHARARRLLESCRAAEASGSIALLARALQEVLGDGQPPWDPQQVADAYVKLVDAVCEEDESEPESDDAQPGRNGLDWQMFEERLRQEFSVATATFARLMDGQQTKKPYARRMLQLAFNRPQSQPKVLVCQSLVGREGLNLHTACKTVVLLHAEWNPGVVEQQIGRVDRIGSLWQSKLQCWLAAGSTNDASVPRPDRLPRITFRPVVFEGTYDEENWRVLRERWANLRAQLHGIIIVPSSEDPAEMALAQAINHLAPNFSPV